MSLVFNDSTNKRGILQRIERWCKLGDAGITGNTQRLKEFTASVNVAFDKVLTKIFQASGKWNMDDSNHTDYPFITTNLVDGQRDYSFTTDEQGNLILDVYKVMVKDESGVFHEIFPVDQQTDSGAEEFYSGVNTEGIPSYYDKTANGIFLSPIPSYNSTNGLKVFINREGSYFTTSDTTKKPGFAGLFHEYLALEPSYEYACINGLENKRDIKDALTVMEADIKKYYRDRSKDEQTVITAECIDSE